MTLFILLLTVAALLGALALFIRYRLSLAEAAEKKEAEARALPADQVQCFSCGLVVPREKALEKKGRYFCGVKRNDRNGNPVQRSDRPRDPGTAT